MFRNVTAEDLRNVAYGMAMLMSPIWLMLAIGWLMEREWRRGGRRR